MTIKQWFRRVWRRRFSPDTPRRYLPSIGWWHTRMCIGGVPMEQALREQRQWVAGATAAWARGEKMR